MDTTITISNKRVKNKSDFLHLTYNTKKNKDAIISVDSSNFGQSGTVTWDKKCPTLSNIEKVTNWMKQSDTEYAKEDLEELTPELTPNEEDESKSLIVFRCDFNKSTNVSNYFPSLKCYNKTSIIDYFKNENRLLENPTTKVSTKMGSSDKRFEQKLVTNYNKSDKTKVISSQISQDFSENKCGDIDEVPLSPEIRKKELCHYLQLMNPADKKEILIFQNRRSTRVRNLTEQKHFQEKLKEISNGHDKDKAGSIENSVVSNSFKELNVHINKLEDSEELEKIRKHFTFPFPPEHFSNDINYFDKVMYKLVPKWKRICRSRNIPCLKTKNIYREKNDKVNKKIMKLKSKQKKLNKRKKVNRITRQRGKSLRSLNAAVIKAIEKKPTFSNKNRTRKSKSVPPSSVKSRQNSPISTRSTRQISPISTRSTRQLSPISTRSTRQISPISTRSTRKISPPKSISSHCEIISVGVNHDDDNVDVDQIMDDMVDFEKLSDEHKKCLIESRILSTKSIQSISNKEANGLPVMSPTHGFSQKDTKEISKMCEKYNQSISSDFINDINKEVKDSTENVISIQKNNEGEEKSNKMETSQLSGGNTYVILNIRSPSSSEVITETSEHSSNSSFQEHDYASLPSKKSDSNENIDSEVNSPINNYLEINTKSICKDNKYEIQPYKISEEKKTLHKSLQFTSRKKNKLINSTVPEDWDADRPSKQTLKSQSHYININPENGSILKAFYVGYNLIICQEFLVSFWMQTPLGNVLGSQNMWIPRGQTQRMVLNNRCLQKDSTEKVICLDTSIVYIELWMKEHKSEMRQGPVADVFVTLYFWKQRQNGLDKKVLQLENINGFADDVQYCVMSSFPKIIVSWHSTCDENILPKRTFIHAYQLATDYQTVSNIFDMEPVTHYVSSLHNIEGYDDLIMGCGENKITLWNVEFGHIIATIELNEIKTPLSTLWVKCDRGFLFALQQCVDRELRLIAINGINHSWKKLASYFPPEGFDRLKGVCIENGLLLSFYDQGILCWNAETGEPVEEINTENDVIPSGVHVIKLEENRIMVKHVLTHLLSFSIEES